MSINNTSEEYNIEVTAFKNDGEYENYLNTNFTNTESKENFVNVVNTIDSFCSSLNVPNAISSKNKYIEISMEFCDSNNIV